MAKRVCVVGAGPGGLAAAMLLARAGLQVTVVERQPQVGGRTSTWSANGYHFDLGPTFFLYPQILSEIYAACGFDLASEVALERLDPQYRLTFGSGGELLATPDIPRMQQEVAKFSAADAAALPRFLAENRHKFDCFRPILQSPWNSWTDLLSPALLKLLPLVRPWRSLDAELGRYFRDPRIRLAFSFQSKYLGMSPFQCPSLFSILSFLEYEFGVFHPLGGCGAVSSNMAELARQMGVEIRLEEPVEEILFQGRRATGIRTKRGCEAADAVVVNADFARAMQKMIPNRFRRKYSDAKLSRKRYSCSTFMLYLGIEGQYSEVPHHSIFMSANYAENLADIEQRHVLSTSPSFYVQNPCNTDPSLAPPGHSTLYVLVPVTHMHENVDWKTAAGPFRERVLDQLAQIGIHDIRRRIRYEKMITPADWDSHHEIYRGATFNLTHHLLQMLHLRPRNRFEEFEGMYLVGGGTHPGSGLPVIFESARISTRLLLNDLGIDSNWMDLDRRNRVPEIAIG